MPLNDRDSAAVVRYLSKKYFRAGNGATLRFSESSQELTTSSAQHQQHSQQHKKTDELAPLSAFSNNERGNSPLLGEANPPSTPHTEFQLHEQPKEKGGATGSLAASSRHSPAATNDVVPAAVAPQDVDVNVGDVCNTQNDPFKGKNIYLTRIVRYTSVHLLAHLYLYLELCYVLIILTCCYVALRLKGQSRTLSPLKTRACET